MPADDKRKVTILTLRKNKEKNIKSVFCTGYSSWQATLIDRAGIDGLLVGDSLGMTELGHSTTIPVTMEQMLSATEAVTRGSKNCFRIGDMPFASYQESDEQAIRNASRFIVSGAEAVKVEGCFVERVKAISKAGMIVMSHVGLTPQSRCKLGGYRVQGKTKKEAEAILDQCLRLQDAGCDLILFEAVPDEVGKMLTEKLDIITVGIGAGSHTHGQLVIMHDLIGLFFEFKSKFVKRYCEAGAVIQTALQEYRDEVRNGQFPSTDQFYNLNDAELEKMLGDPKWKYTLEEQIEANLR